MRLSRTERIMYRLFMLTVTLVSTFTIYDRFSKHGKHCSCEKCRAHAEPPN